MNPLRIVLVDDSAIFRSAAAAHLSEFPSVGRLEVAQSADEAFARLDTEVFDLVFMDISMPGMDGITATARIKARSGAPRIVVVTAHDVQEYRAAALAAGADGFVLKENFFESIESLLRHLRQSGSGPNAPDQDLRKYLPEKNMQARND